MSVYPAVIGIGKRLFRKIRFDDQGIEIIEPAIFVANHEGSFGPVAVYLKLPVKVRPWIISDLMDRKKCPEYLAREFASGELHIPRPFDLVLSGMASRFCIGLFNHIGAISVHSKSRRIMETIAESIVCLEEGGNLLIFPEIPGEALNKYVKRFKTGFIELAKNVEKTDGDIIRIYPLAASRKYGRIILGKPSLYSIGRPYEEEKARIKQELESSISSLLEMMENGG